MAPDASRLLDNGRIFQIARLARPISPFLMAEYPDGWQRHHEAAWRYLVHFSIASMPIITSGEPAANCCA
jgi:hypothetical protein